MTPMMQQYLSIKERAAGALLFYRMGDFYELFFEDAVTAAAALDITLTRRGQHEGEDIPMAGVPHHSAEIYLSRLIRAGHSVAICEQTEDPKEAKKRGAKAVVAREIVRIVTPGTLTEDTLLEAGRANYLAGLVLMGEEAGLAALDISTGELLVEGIGAGGIEAALAALDPAELLLAENHLGRWPGPWSEVPTVDRDLRAGNGRDRLARAFGVTDTDGLGTFTEAEFGALGAVLGYAAITACDGQLGLRPPKRRGAESVLQIDAATRTSLEIVRTQSGGGSRGALLGAVDRTRTAAGRRLLAARLSSPLTARDAIEARLDAVEALGDDPRARARLRESLRGFPDLDRALGRVAAGRAVPADLAAIGQALGLGRELGEALPGSRRGELTAIGEGLAAAAGPGAADLGDRLVRALGDDLPSHMREGGYIRGGYDADLDRLRTLGRDARRVIAELEARYREATSVRGLKIKHSRVLGYFVEVTQTHAETLRNGAGDITFHHRQTLANAMRFSTDALSDLDREIAEAGEGAVVREREIFLDLTDRIGAERESLLLLADAAARLDVHCGFAELGEETHLVRPELTDAPVFKIEGGRHPVVESALGLGTDGFVPNDCTLSEGTAPLLAIVTGPNMAGKSTYLRQNAVLVVLAQAGSFVPATRARMGIVDRLYSRVGASDDLARGRSTFMVEMLETAAILNQATARSLVILDEIGRGTATYDGMAIAQATLEHLHDRIGCRGLFATHYHELTTLSHRCERVRNLSMAAREWKNEVIFLHEVKAGAADRSYGLAVAKLAGLPRPVLVRARQVLAGLEAAKDRGGTADPLPLFADAPGAGDDPGGDPDAEGFAEPDPRLALLAEVDPEEMSPREALDFLFRLREAISP